MLRLLPDPSPDTANNKHAQLIHNIKQPVIIIANGLGFWALVKITRKHRYIDPKKHSKAKRKIAVLCLEISSAVSKCEIEKVRKTNVIRKIVNEKIEP